MVMVAPINMRWRTHNEMPPLRSAKDDVHLKLSGVELNAENVMEPQDYTNSSVTGRRVAEYGAVGGGLPGHLSVSTSLDKETSAVDAMLKLSRTSPKHNYLSTNAFPGNSMNDNSMKAVISPTSKTAAVANTVAPTTSDFKTAHTFSTRKHREFIPEFRKDDQYWSKRRKNNDAAKRSREKRRMNDIAMGAAIVELTEYNNFLVKEIEALKKHMGLPAEKSFLTGEAMPVKPVAKGIDLSCLPPSIQKEFNTESRSTASLPQPGRQVSPKLPLDSKGSACIMMPTSRAKVPILVPVSSSNADAVAPLDSDNVYANPPPQYVYNNQSLTPSQVVPAAAPVAQAVLSGVREPPDVARSVSSDLNLPQQTHYLNAQDLTHASQVDAIGSNSSFSSSNYSIPQSHILSANSTQISPMNPQPCINDAPINEAAVFHSNLKAPEIGGPLSPVSSIGDSPRSQTVSFTNSDSSDGEMLDRSPIKHHYMPTPPKPSEGSDGSNVSTPYDYSYPTPRARKGIPHKLRHKYNDTYFQSSTTEPGVTSTMPAASMAMTKSSTVSVIEIKPESDENSEKSRDSKYFARRYRNNIAAQKCREIRKQRTNLSIAKATILETENLRLKEELGSLASEVNNLKGLIQKKKEAQAKGEIFQLPNMEVDDDDKSYIPPPTSAALSSSSIEASSSDAS